MSTAAQLNVQLERYSHRVGAPPCEQFNCPSLAACRANETACAAFSTYVSGNRLVDPIARVRAKDTGEERSIPPQPSAKAFQRIFPGETHYDCDSTD